MILSPDDIKRIVSQPSKLPSSASADDYELEKYRRVTIEAVAVFAEHHNSHMNTDDDILCPHDASCLAHDDDCRRCWREALEREGMC